MITIWLEIVLSNAIMATILAAMALVVTRRLRPQWAFAVWLLVLVKLLVPPVWNAPLGTLRAWMPTTESKPGIDWLGGDPSPWAPAQDTTAFRATDLGMGVIAAKNAQVPEVSSLPAFEVSAASIVFFMWCLGGAVWICLALLRIRAFVVGLRQARRAPASLQREVHALAEALGLKRIPVVRLSRRRVPPLVWAMLGRPTILLPTGLLRILSPPQRTALLMHELVHLRRRDHVVKLVELAAIALYWWLPAAWWARRKLEQAAEHCCDVEVVARLPDASRAYAEALVATIDFLSVTPTPLPLGASGFSQFGHVSRRIEMILEPQPRRPRALLSCLVLIVASMAVLPLSVRTLWAEPAEGPEEAKAETSKEKPTVTAEPKPADSTVDDEAPTGGEFVEGEVGKDWNVNNGLTREKVDDQLRKLVNKFVSPIEVASERRAAAVRQLAALEAAYEADTVTLDQLLEAQRRAVEAELRYAGQASSLCRDTKQRQLLYWQSQVLITSEAMNNARRTWHKVYTRSRAGGQGREAQAEAQAREQFYQFKSQLQLVIEQYGLAQDRAGSLTWEKRVLIVGPVTSGGLPRALDPPNDEEVIRAVQRMREKESRPAFDFPDGDLLQIITEKIDEYVDPPKSYPRIGRAQQHHVHYKFTLYRKTSAVDDPFAVIYVDHNHFHRVEDLPTGAASIESPIGVVDRSAEFFIGPDR
jgi:beta-lactamase regulating signal transducer with metallopeptidase domain